MRAIMGVEIDKENGEMIYYTYLKDALMAQKKKGGTIKYCNENKGYYLI
jgi:hypothetical protein